MARRTHVLTFLIRSLKPLVWPSFLLLLATTLGACGGTGLRPEPLPYASTGPIASASDGHVRVTLDALIVRDGPGSWARNADWDEYRLTVENLAETPVLLDRMLVVDSFGLPTSGEASRRALVRASRDSLRRHDDAGLDVRAGAGSGSLLGTGAAVTALGVGTVSAAGTGALISGGTASVGGATAAASGLLIVGPVLITTGIVRGINNAKVNEQIEVRHTPLPLSVPAATATSLQLFFPIVPSPRHLLLSYRSGGVTRHIVVDTSSALDELHIDDTAEES